ncbi:hypothetical protein IKF63_02635 [Candidatus Saccharibacteria bacterium]|nr:hypothetical protein [Candidatus Saccharibacteria bacterium]
MKYLAVLGRLPKISLAELESRFRNVMRKKDELGIFESYGEEKPEIGRLGGVLKLGEELPSGFNSLVEFLEELPEGKITLGVSDFRKGASARKAQAEALKLKKILQRRGRSVRVLQNKTAVLSTATSHHNQLAEKKNHVEIMMTDFGNFKLIGVQNISEYKKRDQVRPARDAKVGMLPPKLAQILINLCGKLPEGARVLDPFCGTGVVLQEAVLDGYRVMGTDLSERMVEYSERNLKWLLERETEAELTKKEKCGIMKRCSDYILFSGDATEVEWTAKIDAVATEVFLGRPMSNPPAEVKLKEEKLTCRTIILGFLKNLGEQVETGTPVVIAVPAWLREGGEYSRLNILDEIRGLGYNVVSFKNLSQEDLLYYREGQIIAREIIVLRKK